MTDNERCEINEKNTKFIVRVLPLEKPCEACARIDTRHKKIYVRCLQEMRASRVPTTKDPSYWCFEADEIFEDSSQDEVYRAVRDLPPKILGGSSCAVIGHGQTGSGKSFTLGGFGNSWEHRGLIPRLLYDMFVEKANRKGVGRIEYRLSCVELHGRETIDLLAPGRVNKIKVNEYDPFKNLSTVSVESHEEALKKVFEAESKRSIVKGSTYPNSHLATFVLTLHIRNTSLITSWRVVTVAKLHLVEMAGNDTFGSSSCRKTAFDVGTANLTKSQLEEFLVYLRGRRTLTYRSNIFLKLLGNPLSPTSIVRLITHVRVTREDLAMTISGLRLGAKIGEFRTVGRTRDVPPESLMKELQKEVNFLRQQLDINNAFLNQEASANISRSRAEQVKSDVLNFLNGCITEFTLFSVSQAEVLLKTVKELYNELTARSLEMNELSESNDDVMRKGENSGGRNSAPDVREIEETAEQVGTLEKSSVTLGPAVQKYMKSEIENPKEFLRKPGEVINRKDQDSSLERQKWKELRMGYFT